MKNLKTLALSIIVLMAACSDDDGPSENSNNQAIEDLEQTPLEANTVADNVIILGGAKSEGTPPEPNGAISLDISDSGETALLNEGFDISLDSDADIIGAYLVFKSNDGIAADSYYDVNLAANSTDKKVKDTKGWNSSLFQKTAKDTDAQLDVDFNTNIEPGTFCYEICVYDADGNISEPEEVCVTVESWGGNSSLVAKWNYVKEEITADGETVVYEVGIPECEVWETECDTSEEPFELSYCFTIDNVVLELKADGTYALVSEQENNSIDFEASNAACEQVDEGNESYGYESLGNWAYITSENRLTLIEYSWTEMDDGETTSGMYDAGDGYALYYGIAEIDGNEFVLTETYDDDGDGVLDGSYALYFEK